jgi:hypothetical protein
MKTYGGVDVQIYIFLTSILPLYPREKSPRYPMERGLGGGGPGAGLDDMEKLKFLTLPGLEIWSLRCSARGQGITVRNKIISIEINYLLRSLTILFDFSSPLEKKFSFIYGSFSRHLLIYSPNRICIRQKRCSILSRPFVYDDAPLFPTSLNTCDGTSRLPSKTDRL